MPEQARTAVTAGSDRKTLKDLEPWADAWAADHWHPSSETWDRLYRLAALAPASVVRGPNLNLGTDQPLGLAALVQDVGPIGEVLRDVIEPQVSIPNESVQVLSRQDQADKRALGATLKSNTGSHAQQPSGLLSASTKAAA
ncbi:hypothetical protein EV189_3673 [Motilibacter rhizosphaerae]|uniref:Uncharacterized protein n=1 Tax=Motilibacter rhizosphaerae TaxID=598652 RepID=A0A4Q7NB44_9ACTN|nr:hypothetical protein EV189_3673 [Motilibacter rhizosphaerae]